MVVAALITVSTWWQIISPPESIAPKGAIDFVKRKNIIGNVFNDYNFGGYLIFSGIPTFVDGRALPFGDAFLHKYFDAMSLADINGTFELLDEYKVTWVILHPNALWPWHLLEAVCGMRPIPTNLRSFWYDVGS